MLGGQSQASHGNGWHSCPGRRPLLPTGLQLLAVQPAEPHTTDTRPQGKGGECTNGAIKNGTVRMNATVGIMSRHGVRAEQRCANGAHACPFRHYLRPLGASVLLRAESHRPEAPDAQLTREYRVDGVHVRRNAPTTGGYGMYGGDEAYDTTTNPRLQAPAPGRERRLLARRRPTRSYFVRLTAER